MAAGPDASHSYEPLGSIDSADAALGPISPELALVDPDLAREARKLLPEPRERQRPLPPLPDRAAPELPVELKRRRPRRWARTLALAIVIFGVGAVSGSFLGNHETRAPGTKFEVRVAAPVPRQATTGAAVRSPTTAPASTTGSGAPRRRRSRRAAVAWAANVLGVEATVGRHGVALLWRAPRDSARVVVLRQTGTRSTAVVVYRGRAMSYRDGSLRACTGYRYTIVNYDRRGHPSTGVPTSVVTRCA